MNNIAFGATSAVRFRAGAFREMFN